MARTLNKPVNEKKIFSLLSNLLIKKSKKLLEASGVVLVDNNYLVIFDDMHGIAKLPKSSNGEFQEGEIIGSQKSREGYEAIAYDSVKKLLYAIVENAPYKNGFYRPQIQPFTMDLTKAGKPLQLPLDLPLDNINYNKGLEGATIVHKNNTTYLFGLCEGKDCNSDDSIEAEGRGMIQVFKMSNDQWLYDGYIQLPIEVDFRDFSDLAIKNNRIAVVSQKSAKLWIGQLTVHQNSWSITHGEIYRFPRKKNKVVYCNVEGVDWVSSNRLVIVSDMASKKRCKKKEMMIHIFDIPH